NDPFFVIQAKQKKCKYKGFSFLPNPFPLKLLFLIYLALNITLRRNPNAKRPNPCLIFTKKTSALKTGKHSFLYSKTRCGLITNQCKHSYTNIITNVHVEKHCKHNS